MAFANCAQVGHALCGLQARSQAVGAPGAIVETIGGGLKNLCFADHRRILARIVHIKKRLASFFSGSRVHMFSLWAGV